MKSIFRKTAALLLTVCSLSTTASAAIPSEYWQYHQPYIDACEAKDHENIIAIGKKIEEIMLKYPLDNDTAANLGNVYNRSASSYLALAQYEEAAKAYEKYIPYAEYLGFTDAVIVSKAATRRLDLDTGVYIATSDLSRAPDYNAKYEPDNGVYYGRAASDKVRPEDDESAFLFYFQFLDEDLSAYDWYLRPLAEDGNRVMELAMNMPKENDSLKQVMDRGNDKYIIETMKYIQSLGCPVLLRIGGEMNVWENLADADLYKQAFRKLANTARKYAPNVATVFAPNFASNFYVSIEDYYPGDEYVDWVGISLYATKYMNAGTMREATEAEKLFYSNGEYANLIAQLKEIVELYGDRKPIMIAESGASHGVNGKNGVDLTDFASRQLEILYTYLNIVYPQVKCVLHFDSNPGASDTYSFSLFENEKLKGVWDSLTSQNSAYLSGMNDKADKTYVKAETYSGKDKELWLYTYCVLPGAPETTVTYTYDGTVIKETKTMPFTCGISAENVSDGEHSLTVSVKGADGYSKVMPMKLTKANGIVTITEAP